MILKANLHSHSREDSLDSHLPYSVYELIDRAKAENFDVLAYTPHDRFIHKKEYGDYAKEKGILLITGLEVWVKEGHIVLLNCDKEAEKIKTFEALRSYKEKNPQIFILAPHPFVYSPGKCIGKKLIEYIDLFDAVELTVFSNMVFNFNKKARLAAEKYDKPLVATSDTHFLRDLDRGYALIDAGEKTVEGVLRAIKEKKVENKTRPMGPFTMARYMFSHRVYQLLKK